MEAMKSLRAVFPALVLLLSGCHEKVDTSARYVFKDNTVITYLEKYSEQYSSYLDILSRVQVSPISETTLYQLLSARGHYTVFAPTNEAIEQYLDTLVAEGIIEEPSWEAFTDSTKLDSVRAVIAYNSIIDSGDYDNAINTYDFPTKQGSEIPIPNMNDRKMTVYYGNLSDTIRIFNKYKLSVRNRDILLLNGVIHQMENVIAPRNITASIYLQDLIDHQKEGFLVIARTIMACGLKDTLNAIRDEVSE